ncbi:ribosome maturation protein SBDS isoform X2 [Populus alba x Populus x berolinensis]|nr:ribosome maturation protein SBDS isoform X2 [Populus alba x Populus x berolinensis]
MQKTINPETQRPYTISMVERLMHEIHFAVDPHSSSKKQALDVIRELQKHFPIKRSPMRLRLAVIGPNFPDLLESSMPGMLTLFLKLNLEAINLLFSGFVSCIHPLNVLVLCIATGLICEMDPGFFRDCDAFVRNLQGRLEILAVSVHFEGDTHVDDFDDYEDVPPALPKESTDSEVQLSEKIQKQTISEEKKADTQAKQNKCSTCNAFVGDAKQFRDHFQE